jgi:hypothetical protein
LLVSDAAQFPIGVIDRAQKPVETWRFFDRPNAREAWPKNVEIVPSQQSYGDYAFEAHSLRGPHGWVGLLKRTQTAVVP